MIFDVLILFKFLYFWCSVLDFWHSGFWRSDPFPFDWTPLTFVFIKSCSRFTWWNWNNPLNFCLYLFWPFCYSIKNFFVLENVLKNSLFYNFCKRLIDTNLGLTHHSIKLGNVLSLSKYLIFENNLIGQYFAATTFLWTGFRWGKKAGNCWFDVIPILRKLQNFFQVLSKIHISLFSTFWFTWFNSFKCSTKIKRMSKLFY